MGLRCSVPPFGGIRVTVAQVHLSRDPRISRTSREKDTHPALDHWYRGRQLSLAWGTGGAPSPYPNLEAVKLGIALGQLPSKINFDEARPVRGRRGVMAPCGWSFGLRVTSCVPTVINRRSGSDVCPGVGNGPYPGVTSA